MYFDESRDVIVDPESGVEIPAAFITDRDEIPDDLRKQIQLKKDHDMAVALQQGGSSRAKLYAPLEMGHTEFLGEVRPQYHNNGANLEEELYQMHLTQPVTPSAPPQGGWMDDFSFARALQAMEFEIAAEMDRTAEDFDNKENRAASCKRQLLTLSTFICLAQIGLLIAMIQDDGYAPQRENPLIGPPATTMVRYGAKETALLLYRDEGWRVFSPIMLHAGILHLISNVFIQLRIGGYLNIVFGNMRWFIIYLTSGVYGNLLSCIFLPDAVGVGSSGAVLGMLCAWVVWIIFRWKKVPPNCKTQRNCQITLVTTAIAMTLAFSFADYVDWAAHFGGCIQGFLMAIVLLSHELDNATTKWTLRLVALALSIASFVWALYYLLTITNPSKRNFDLYDENDDWN